MLCVVSIIYTATILLQNKLANLTHGFHFCKICAMEHSRWCLHTISMFFNYSLPSNTYYDNYVLTSSHKLRLHYTHRRDGNQRVLTD